MVRAPLRSSSQSVTRHRLGGWQLSGGRAAHGKRQEHQADERPGITFVSTSGKTAITAGGVGGGRGGEDALVRGRIADLACVAVVDVAACLGVRNAFLVAADVSDAIGVFGAGGFALGRDSAVGRVFASVEVARCWLRRIDDASATAVANL